MSQTLTLFLCGDVMTGRGVDQILAHPAGPQLHEPYVKDARRYVELAEQAHGKIPAPVDDRYVWGFALDVLDNVNPAARIINLETAVTTCDRYWQGKGINYRMSPKNVGCLQAARLDCCALANNHVLDWGYPGLDETLRTLHEAGLKTTGAGRDDAEANLPAELATAQGNRILVFCVGMYDSGIPPAWEAGPGQAGVAFLPDFSSDSLNEVAAMIDAAQPKKTDIVVLSIHWGGNWGYEVSLPHRAFAQRVIDEAGVDIVHGHSSHHAKGIEVHHGRLILYGCGDLITDYEGIAGKEAYRGDLGLLYLARIDCATGALNALRMQPAQMRQMQLRRPPPDDVAWLEKMFNREGAALGTGVTIVENGNLELGW